MQIKSLLLGIPTAGENVSPGMRTSGLRPANATSARPFVETLLFFVLLVVVDHAVAAGDAFAALEPHPFWLPVILMAVAYGSGPGLLAAILASLIWVLDGEQVQTGDHLERMLSLSILPMLWVTTALVTGEITSSHLGAMRRLARHRNRLTREQNKLTEIIGELAETNRALQVRIALEERTIADAIAAAVELVDMRPSQQLAGIERLVNVATKGGAFTFYVVVGDQLLPLLRGNGARGDLRSDGVIADIWRGAIPGDQPIVQVSPRCAVVPVYADGDPYLRGLLSLEGMGEEVLTQSMRAALIHIAYSLGQLANEVPAPAEPMKLPQRPWLLAQEHAA